MTLDPVHVEEIAAFASEIHRDVDDDDHDDVADRVWREFLDPLTADGDVVLEPVDDQYTALATIDEIALADRPYPTVHGLDAGAMNPTTFVNGAVVDVAHAAMACDPSAHELHRRRSIVGAIHRNNPTGRLPDRWQRFDEGYARRRWLQAPPVDRFAEGVVHALALGVAETSHAADHLDAVDDVLVLDGPIYPKELLRWRDRHSALRELLLSERLPREVLQSAVDLVAATFEADVALAGFVKNPASNRLTRAIRSAGVGAPWFNDAGFFRRVLDPTGTVDRPRAHLAYTNWFVSRAGTDGALLADGTLDVAVDGPAERYEMTFMIVYDPRDDVVYRVEAPRGLVADTSARDRLRTLVLRDVAANRGPPTAVAKADALARIGRGQKRTVRRLLERAWDTDVDVTYDDLRWGTE